MAICGALGFIPYLGSIAGIVQLIMWIIYWVKMSGYKTQLEQTPFQFSNVNANPNNYQYQNQNYGYQQPPQQYGNPYNQNPPPPPVS
jgi:predicted PurR-regulated permease PerM